MTKSKRPWKKHALIMRTETHGGDVQFVPYRCESQQGVGKALTDRKTHLLKSHFGNRMWTFGSFESLTDAEKDLDAWWATYWQKQVKSERRA